MSLVIDGVLIPAEMADQPIEELQAYAATVKRGNRAFIDAYFALEDRAAKLGIELEAGA